MRAERPSITASLVAALRALYTEMPEPYRLTADPVAASLVPAALALPARAVAHFPGAAPAVHRALTALTLGLNQHVPLRTRAIDDALLEAVRLGATQLVVLGAGLDNRALRLVELAGVRAFEVDHPSTQRYKVARLATMRQQVTPAAAELHRVAVDFENENEALDRALLAAGFRADVTAFWIWEGVTLYLTPAAIAETLRAVAAISAPGSRIALTYGCVSEDRVPSWALPLAKRLLDLAGEPMRSPLGAAAMEELLASAGFTRLADDSTVEWAARYWPWETGVRPIERLAIAERQ